MSDELEEARTLLRDAAMARLRAHSARKDKGAKALFEQLKTLNDVHGLRMQTNEDEWNEVVVQIGKIRGLLVYLSDHGVRLRVDDKELDVVLDFDPSTQAFVGREPDRFHTPVPGQPIPRRPAIAVLVESILKLLSPAGLADGR
jgi:hypothetical protein